MNWSTHPLSVFFFWSSLVLVQPGLCISIPPLSCYLRVPPTAPDDPHSSQFPLSTERERGSGILSHFNSLGPGNPLCYLFIYPPLFSFLSSPTSLKSSPAPLLSLLPDTSRPSFLPVSVNGAPHPSHTVLFSLHMHVHQNLHMWVCISLGFSIFTYASPR